MQTVDPQQREMETHLSSLLGQNVLASERVGGGKNSQVFHLVCAHCQYAVKRYFRHSADTRDRLGTEYSALHFMWQNGLRCIPQPILTDRDNGYAVYEYIEGEKIDPPSVTSPDIDDAVAFLSRLEELKGREESASFGGASEACFSIQAVVDNVQKRLQRLTTVQDQGTHYESLREFLAQDFIPAFADIITWCQLYAEQNHISFTEDIPPTRKTLSPSDFGYHNALKRAGQIVFLDFEYFGWDDPAKMIVDFLLHPAPAMQIRDDLKRKYVRGLLKHFANDESLVYRTQIVYPLFGLKWIMIILNEFLPADLMRRQFAQQHVQDKGKLQVEQLEKAKQWLHKIQSEYRSFPYT